MFYRKITEQLRKWKSNPQRPPLIIQGLRQVGKTAVAIAFGNEHYDNVFYVDFRKQIDAHAIFDGDFDIDAVAFALSTLPQDKRIKKGAKLQPGNALFIFGEIQDCLNARSCLKYFRQDGRYDVVCTGSLLGVKDYRRIKQPNRGIDVGSEELITMYPMDFEEFFLATGGETQTIDLLRSCLEKRKQIPDFFHKKLSELFLQYLLIGGMPEVVAEFCATKDYALVRQTQKRLLADFSSDFGTHLNDDLTLETDDVERAIISETFLSIPRQLAKENKKFQYSVIKPRGDARTYGFAIDYLNDYGLIEIARNVSELDFPLDYFVKEGQFKIYFADEGLFMAMLDDTIPSMVLCDELGTGKGMLYENIVANAFHKMGRKLFYYRRDSGLEIEFVSPFSNDISLIEAKPKSGTSKAASTLLNDTRCKAKHLVRITSSNIGYVNNILTIPHYMTFLLNELRFESLGDEA